MTAYAADGHAYHATQPTDSLRSARRHGGDARPWLGACHGRAMGAGPPCPSLKLTEEGPNIRCRSESGSAKTCRLLHRRPRDPVRARLREGIATAARDVTLYVGTESLRTDRPRPRPLWLDQLKDVDGTVAGSGSRGRVSWVVRSAPGVAKC
jgi:hypothetical protein